MNKPKALMLEYQLYTQCNLSCDYCYNYFDENVTQIDFYRQQLDEVLRLYHDNCCFVLNGGEPFLCKDLVNLVNYITEPNRNVYTYTNGTLPPKVYANFIEKLKHKDRLYMTFSVHPKEIFFNGRLTKQFLENISLFSEHVPNLKMNFILTSSYKSEYLSAILEALKDIKRSSKVKYINFLIEDSLVNDPKKLVEILSSKEMKHFITEVDIMFDYRNCRWDNRRKTSTEVVEAVKLNAVKEIMRIDFDTPSNETYHELSFLKYGKQLVVETSLDVSFDGMKKIYLNMEHDTYGIDEADLSAVVDYLLPIVQKKEMREIEVLRDICDL